MKKLFLLLVFVFLLGTNSIYANMIWPSLYISEGMRIWWIIAIGLVIEFIFVKLFTKDNYLKSIIMVITMNLISALVGFVAIPLVGILGEIILFPIDSIFNLGTFHISHWIFAYLLTASCNASIETLVLKFIFKKIYKNIILWLFCANVFSVIICAIKLSI